MVHDEKLLALSLTTDVKPVSEGTMCKECHYNYACSVFIAEAHSNVECGVVHGEKY